MPPSVLEKVPDQIGYLVVNQDGAVIASGGELENDERIAKVIYDMVKSSEKTFLLPAGSNETFKRLTINYEDHLYAICLSNRKINVVKKKYYSTKPVSA